MSIGLGKLGIRFVLASSAMVFYKGANAKLLNAERSNIIPTLRTTAVPGYNGIMVAYFSVHGRFRFLQ